MKLIAKVRVMPTKLKYKMLVSFCVMSLLPILSGVYVASLFVQFPFVINEGNLMQVTLIAIFSLVLSLLGYQLAKEVTMPIVAMNTAVKSMAAGQLDPDINFKGADELEELSESLKKISNNAKDLLEKVEKLTTRDKLTGLYNANYIRERLDEEIERAIHYQRPCSFVYFVMDNFRVYEALVGEAGYSEAMQYIAKILTQHSYEFARAARITKEEFAIILPDKNKKKAIEIAEQICGQASAFLTKKSEKMGVSLSIYAGVSEDPLDGVRAEDLITKAKERVKAARLSGKSLEAFA